MANVIKMKNSSIENIETAAREDAGFEKILKFKKGEYSIQDQSIPLGTEYLAHTSAWTKCWIKFADGKVVERKVYRVALGEKPPGREELDDLDRDEWPEGLDGEPSDPWVYQFLLPLEIMATGEVIVFVTASRGGRTAVADLCTNYVKRAKKVANGGQPIIKLSKADMTSPRFGKVPRPLFEIVCWDDDVEFLGPPLVTSEGDFDEVPF